MAELASAGKIKIHIDRTYPLAQAANAQVYSQEGHAQGKVLLIVDPAKALKK